MAKVIHEIIAMLVRLESEANTAPQPWMWDIVHSIPTSTNSIEHTDYLLKVTEMAEKLAVQLK